MTSTHLWITLLVILSTFTLPSHGQVTDLCFTLNGDVSLQVAAIKTPLTAAEWYNYANARANTPNAFEERWINRDRVTMYFLDASDGIHLGHMMDSPGSGTDGKLDLDFQVSPARIIKQVSLKVEDDPGETAYDSDTGIITGRYRWIGRLMDGMVIGPFSTDEPYCVTVINAANDVAIFGYALYDAFENRDYSGSVDQLLGLEICTVDCVVPPPTEAVTPTGVPTAGPPEPPTVSPSAPTIAPTAPPTTAPPTLPPTTKPPTTLPPTTKAPTTKPPTTRPPTTNAPTTKAPTTKSPTTRPPTTNAPVTIPTTKVPTTKSPTTRPPTTKSPTTKPPTTKSPTTKSPTTKAPTTISPTTKAPTTKAPTTKAPTTRSPTTLSPTTAPTISPTEEPTPPFEAGAIVVIGDNSGTLPWWIIVLIAIIVLLLCCCCCLLLFIFFWYAF